MEINSIEDYLIPPEGRTLPTLVNSPTTDTLDSVLLETSTADDLYTGEEDTLSGNENRNTSNGIEDSEGGLDKTDNGILFVTHDDMTIDSSLTPSTDPRQIDIFSENYNPETNCNPNSSDNDKALSNSEGISSYFATCSNGDDFFDSLGPLQESPVKLKGKGHVFDGAEEIENNITTVNEIGSKSSEVESIQPVFLNEQDVEMFTDMPGMRVSVDVDVTHIIHREHKVSHSEPETIAFEGEEEVNDDVKDIQELSDKDEFESFTAQGSESDVSDLISTSSHSASFLERSKSLPLGQLVLSSSHHASNVERSCSLPGGQQLPIVGEDTGLGLQNLNIGTASAQMSPSATPSHKPGFTPSAVSQASSQAQTVSSESQRYDRQSSIPPQSPLPGSPFYAAIDSGPLAGSFQPFGEVVDDIFTACLSMSDTDRRYDAWIPSDATRHILITMTTSPPGSFFPSVEQLSTPGLLTSEPQGDPVRDLVFRYMGEQESIQRQVLRAGSVSQDFDGLRRLVEAGCFRAAVDLTGLLLTGCGQGEGKVGQWMQHSPQMLQLWFCRLALLTKLRLFEMAESEMRAFQNLDTPDLYFEFYPQIYPGRRGSMVCFAMRMLHADLPHLNGRSQETLDRLYYILAVTRKILNNLDNDLCEDGNATQIPSDCRMLSKELWQEREKQVLYRIASALFSVKDFQAALAVYNMLLEKDTTRRADLLTGISRIHLQIGNVAKANEMHLEVEKSTTKGDNSSASRNAMNKGLSAMCVNNFSEAYTYFKSAVQLEPSNACAVNNMAVCSLYLGRLKDALNTLEAMVHSDPARNLHEGILFNLCTLYELESSRALHKKQAVLDLVSKHKGDGFPVACLKMG